MLCEQDHQNQLFDQHLTQQQQKCCQVLQLLQCRWLMLQVLSILKLVLRPAHKAVLQELLLLVEGPC